MLRKLVPGDVDFSIERAAAKIADKFLKMPGLKHAHLCFDTPGCVFLRGPFFRLPQGVGVNVFPAAGFITPCGTL